LSECPADRFLVQQKHAREWLAELNAQDGD
jgi:hypothetical protein